MALIQDPDLLNQGIEVTYNTTDRTIALSVAGNLSTDGVTLQALYSFTKEEWKNDATLIKFPFPFVPITSEQFEIVNGWKPADQATVDLIRNSGFAVKYSDGTSAREYAGVITLGEIGVTDQVYYQQVLDGSSKNVVLQGAVNQAVKMYATTDARTDIAFDTTLDTITITDATIVENFEAGDIITVTGSASNNGTFTITDVNTGTGVITVAEDLTTEAAGASVTITADYRGFFQIFVREQAKIYASADKTDIGVTTFTYQAYRFPLANATDLKVTHDDITADAYGVTVDYTSTVQRNIGGSNYNFDIVIDGNNRTAEEIYEAVQSLLRKDSDIDNGIGNVTGKTADELLAFVGDTLVTSTGVFIDNYQSADINRIEFYDNLDIKRTFPFVASGTINFNDNLVNDGAGIYKMFFTDLGSGQAFGTTNAILVDNNSGADIEGNIVGPSVAFDFDYDNNVQGGRTGGADESVTVVAIGLNTGQYVSTVYTITRDNANNITLVAALERNYQNL